MKLYYYTDFNGHEGWYPNLAAFRKGTKATMGWRVCSENVPAPSGYVKTGRGLANEPAVPE